MSRGSHSLSVPYESERALPHDLGTVHAGVVNCSASAPVNEERPRAESWMDALVRNPRCHFPLAFKGESEEKAVAGWPVCVVGNKGPVTCDTFYSAPRR